MSNSFLFESMNEESKEPSQEKKEKGKRPKRTSSKKFNFAASTIIDEEVINRRIDEHWAKVDGLFQCTICGKNFKNAGHAKEHVETHMDDIAFPCRDETCGELQRTRGSRRAHEKKHKMGQ